MSVGGTAGALILDAACRRSEGTLLHPVGQV